MKRSGHSRILLEYCRFSLFREDYLKVVKDVIMLRDIGITFPCISILC